MKVLGSSKMGLALSLCSFQLPVIIINAATAEQLGVKQEPKHQQQQEFTEQVTSLRGTVDSVLAQTETKSNSEDSYDQERTDEFFFYEHDNETIYSGIEWLNTSTLEKEERKLLVATPSRGMQARFRAEHDLKPDAVLQMQYIFGRQIYINDSSRRRRVIRIDQLEPMNVFKSSMYQISNKFFDLEQLSKSILFVGQDDTDGAKILVTKENGTIRAIHIIELDGSYTYLASISRGILVSITPDMAMNDDPFDDPEDMLLGNVRRLFDSSNGAVKTDIETESSIHRILQTTTKIAEVDMFFDSTYCLSQGGEEQTLAAIARIVGLTSQIYQAQGINVQLKINNINGFCTSPDDFTPGLARNNIGCSGVDGVVQFFGDWLKLKYPNFSTTADAAHMFFSQSFSEQTTGCATYNTLCTSNAYGVENMAFSKDDVRTSALFAHELGHNFGLRHVVSPTGVNYVMDAIGFQTHIWSPASITNLTASIPTFSCLSSGTRTTPAPRNPSTTTPPATTPPATTPPATTPPATTPPATISPVTSPPVTSPPSVKATSPPTKNPLVNNLIDKRRPDGSDGKMYSIKPLTNQTLCFNIPQSDTSNNPIVHLWSCTGNKNQLWEADNFGFIHSALNKAKCIGLDPFGARAKQALKLYDCRTDRFAPAQEWKYNTISGKLKNRWRRRQCIQISEASKPVRTSKCNKTESLQGFIFVEESSTS